MQPDNRLIHSDATKRKEKTERGEEKEKENRADGCGVSLEPAARREVTRQSAAQRWRHACGWARAAYTHNTSKSMQPKSQW
jgi:hypothetical protein